MIPSDPADTTVAAGDSILHRAVEGSTRVSDVEVLEVAASAAYHAGQDVAGYRLVRLLGSGGQGAVWEAEERDLRRRVALKLVHPGRIDERALQFFAREARAGGRLQHPDIVATYAHGESEGVAWIAQELVADSHNLAQVIASTRSLEVLPIGYYRRIAEFVARVADALEAAHSAGVVHRDVKPGNILVAANDAPKLTDFGLARVTDETGLTETGTVIGTVLYMSPEQIRGVRTELDHRTDIFSLGVVLYELLTLRRPFEGDSVPQICSRIQESEPIDPSLVRSRCPRDLATICLKALEKRRQRRYSSAAELAADLRRFLAHESIVARPSGPVRRALMWALRHPVVVTALVVTTGALVVISYLLVQNVAARERISPLADLLLLRRLEGLVHELVPLRDENAPALDAWLETSDQLQSRLEVHRRRAARLGEGLQESEAMEAVGWSSWDPAAMDLVELPELAELLGEGVALDVGLTREQLTPWVVEREGGRGVLFLGGESSRAAMAAVTAELAASLDAFIEGPIPALMEARWELASGMRRESVELVADRWAEAQASIATSPRYGGLNLPVQVGLIPLRQDPSSGLWEFFVHGSGAMPEVDPSSGRYSMSGEEGIVLVLVPGGEFWMGADRAAEATTRGPRIVDDRAPSDVAARLVGPLDSFFIGKHEVSQGQWFRLTSEAPSAFGADASRQGDSRFALDPDRWSLPVERVNWDEARRGLAVLGLELPTEAQWEFAVRAGTTTWWWFGDSIDEGLDAINVCDRALQRSGLGSSRWQYIDGDDGYALTAPIDFDLPNPNGLHGTVGNVFEWCLDAADTMAVASRRGDEWEFHGFGSLPIDPASGRRRLVAGDLRVVRGGAYRIIEDEAASVYRRSRGRDWKSNIQGLRAARAIEW